MTAGDSRRFLRLGLAASLTSTAIGCQLPAAAPEVEQMSDTTTIIARPEPFVGLAAGGQHACGWTATGQGYCWGANVSGQLGNGSTDAAETPTRVSGTVHFTQLVAGAAFTCGLGHTGEAHCWGDNQVGQLGNGEMLVGSY